MKKNNNAPKNSRRHLRQNLFILTRLFFGIIFGPDPKAKKRNLALQGVLIGLLPLLIILVPILDVFLIFFLPGLHLFRPLFKAGWKYALISSIGVTLAVSIVTQYVFFIYSYQFQAFDLYLADEPRTYIQVEVENVYVELATHQYFFFDNIANLAVDFINMSHRILQTDLFFKLPAFTQVYDPINNETILPTMPLYGTEGRLRSFIGNRISMGSSPTNESEAVAIVTRDFLNHSTLENGSVIPLYVPISLDLEDSLTNPAAQTQVNITGIVILDEIPDYQLLNSDIGIPLETILELEGGAAIVSWWTYAGRILHDIEYTGGLASLHEDLFYDVTLIDAFDIQLEIDILKTISLELKDWYLT
ncbi:MAG: hypothetical protein ACXABK_03825, partial [Candidatus Heimdallarchaeaceae archaeon]